MSQLTRLLVSTALLTTSTFFTVPMAWAAPVIQKADNQVGYEIGKRGGTLTISTASGPKTFNPYLAAETSSTDIIEQLFLGLVKTNPITTEIEPSLAESWTISPDKLTYTLQLREGLKWSDGKPLTADDVVFTYNEIINNENIPNNYRDGLLIDNQFPKVNKIDTRHVSFTISKPFAPFLRGLSDPIVPKHVLQGATQMDEDGQVKFNEMWAIDTDPEKIIVNGPWKLDDYNEKTLELNANPYFHLKDANGQALPYLESLRFRISRDWEQELKWFNTDQNDVLVIQNTKEIQRIIRDTSSVYDLGPSIGTSFVMFNQSQAQDSDGKPVVDPIKNAWFRNQKFRQALAFATDKQKMITQIYDGKAGALDSHITSRHPFYASNLPAYTYDLKKAQDLLSSAGFKKNAQGKLLDPKGHIVRFKLVTNQGNQQRDAACKIVVADWAKLGIQVDYQMIDFNVMVYQIDATLDWDAMMLGLTGSAIEAHSGINSWKLDGRMHMFNMGHANNWQGKKPTNFDPWEIEVLELYEQAAAEFDVEKRKQLYWKAQAIVADQVPFLFTVTPVVHIAVADHIGNLKPSIHGGSGFYSVLWNTERLYIK